MSTRTYKQGVASLGFPGGPSVVLRLNPSLIDWRFQIDTNVTETVGGRVVQVLGATLSDLTIKGSFGERRGGQHVDSKTYSEAFLAKMKEMAAWQSRDAGKHQAMHNPAVFVYPPKNWRFQVYIKDLSDPDGGNSITHRPGKFAYDYVLTLMVHADLSDTSQVLGKSNGVLAKKKDAAISSYIERIADGIGWRFTEFNGPGGTSTIVKESVGATSGTGAHKVGSKPSER